MQAPCATAASLKRFEGLPDALCRAALKDHLRCAAPIGSRLTQGANVCRFLPRFEGLQEMKEREAEFEDRLHKLYDH
jgi:hypothetical protein